MIAVKRLGMGAFALLAAAVTPASAQVSPFGPGAFSVPNSDAPLLRAAEAKLYDPAAKVGAHEHWSNPETGDEGSVTLISTFERDGMACRRIAHLIKVRGNQVQRQFVISRCKAADG